jgi:GNAT superfamily N-acetyltransferase
MSRHTAGSRIDYRVTHLEMRARPAYEWPALPSDGSAVSLLRAETPPAWYLRALYDAVGHDHAWEDLHREPDAELGAWLADPGVGLWSLMRDGWPQGFFILDARAADRTVLSLLGLVPDLVGRGYGRFLVRTAIHTAWERKGLERLTVETCSLDHPRALAVYQQAGFQVVSQETRSRVLRHDLDPSRWPP